MSETTKIHNVEYRFYATQEKGKFYGYWTDMETGETGGSSKVCSSEGEAIEAAKGNAVVSHFRRHPKTNAI